MILPRTQKRPAKAFLQIAIFSHTKRDWQKSQVSVWTSDEI